MKKGIWILCAVLVLGILCEFLANLPALLSPARNQAKQIPLSSVTGTGFAREKEFLSADETEVHIHIPLDGSYITEFSYDYAYDGLLNARITLGTRNPYGEVREKEALQYFDRNMAPLHRSIVPVRDKADYIELSVYRWELGDEGLEDLMDFANLPLRFTAFESSCVPRVNPLRLGFFWAVFAVAGMVFCLRDVFARHIERGFLVMALCFGLLFSLSLPANKVSWDEEDELAEFAARADVVVVEDGGRKDGGEADCAMLQMAEVFEDSVCLTQDRFLDYANVHPSIVGTRRVRPFSVAMLEGRIIVLVSGLVRAIAIDVRDSGVLSVEKDEREITQPPVDMPAPAELPAEDKVLGHEAPEQVASEPEEVTAACVTEECAAENDAPAGSLEEAYVRKADLLLARGEGERAVRYLCRVAEKDYRAYYALAEHYAGKDVKLERKYLRLAAAAERRDRKTRLRYERRFAAAKRDGLKSGHLSRRTRAQVGMAKFASDHHAITGWLETHREFRRRPYGRVA